MSTPITVGLSPRAMEAMRALGHAVDGTPESLINNAILIYLQLENLRAMGTRVYIVDERSVTYEMAWRGTE